MTDLLLVAPDNDDDTTDASVACFPITSELLLELELPATLLVSTASDLECTDCDVSEANEEDWTV